MTTEQFELHVVTDGIQNPFHLIPILREVAAAGATTIQLRYKNMPALELYEISRQLSTELANEETALVVNDRVDIALALNLPGVHLGGSGLPIPAAKRILGPSVRIGRSVHSLPEALQAQAEGASYITYGHIFESNSKPKLPPRGLRSLQEIVDQVSIPVIAIGGIHAENVQDVLKTGVAGIAVIGAILSQDNPGQATEQLWKLLRHSPYRPKECCN